MKAISLLQPWASLMVLGEKKIETRGRAIKFTGTVAIHASKKFTREQKEIFYSEPFITAFQRHGISNHDMLPLGAIIGQVNLWSSRRIVSADADNEGMHFTKAPEEPELSFGNYRPERFAIFSKWPEMYMFHYPCKGTIFPLLWDVPEEVLKQMPKIDLTKHYTP